MSFLESLILGIIQGLTEFLPVSSSGHLELGKALFGSDTLPEESLLFTVVVHAATALSTVVVFRKDILAIITDSLKGDQETLRFIAFIVLSMVPAAIIGLAFQDEIEQLFTSNILLVGSMLLITGLLLFVADKAQNTNKSVGFGSALLIGISQAIAILPGISRSGATISTAVLLKIDREKAARFSFLMVVPLILGKMTLDMKELAEGGITLGNGSALGLVVGFIAAFITGWWACRWMISLVKQARLRYFGYYCLIVGIAAIIVYSI